jgi:hypothetical protein
MRFALFTALLLVLSGCSATDELALGAAGTIGGCALLDTNDDEAIGGDEAATVLFTRYDSDNDGMLTRAEFSAGVNRGTATRGLANKFGDWDDDSNGMLTRVEFVDGAGDDDSFVGIADAGCDEIGL